MLKSMIRAALSQRLLVMVVAAILLGFGVRAAMQLSVDAFPDVTNVQVQVATEVPGRSPAEVERLVAVPPAIAALRCLGGNAVNHSSFIKPLNKVFTPVIQVMG